MRRLFGALRLGTTFVIAGELLFLVMGVGSFVVTQLFPDHVATMQFVRLIVWTIGTVFLAAGTMLGIAAPPIAGARGWAILTTLFLLVQSAAGIMLVFPMAVLAFGTVDPRSTSLVFLIGSGLGLLALSILRSFSYKMHLRQLAAAIGRHDVKAQATGVLIFDSIIYGLIIVVVGAALALPLIFRPPPGAVRRVQVRPVAVRGSRTQTLAWVIAFGIAGAVVLLGIVWLILYLRLVYAMRKALEEEIQRLR